MNLVNICSAELGAQILAYSSTSDEEICQPSHVLLEKEDKIWNSGEGLPQYLIISLENVSFRYSHIDTMAFFCWHDYTTNPKTIEIEVAQQPEDKFTFWVELNLKLQIGRQSFKIPELPSCFKIVKFIITETFGDDETYLNQILLMAKPFDSQMNSEMSVNQLEYCSYQKDQSYKHQKPVNKPRNSRKEGQREIQIGDLKEDEEEDSFHSQHFKKQRNDIESLHKRDIDDEVNMQQHEEIETSSFENNVALLGLSQKMIEMEQNIESVRRNLQILDLKVSISYQTLEKNVMDKVEKIVDKKIKKVQEELRAEMKPTRAPKGAVDMREVKSQKDKLEFISSRQLIEDTNEQYFKTKGRSMRDAPKSLHIDNLDKGESSKPEGVKKTVISGLMSRLADKLKEREVKLKKMENTKRQKHQYC